jgi:hypothetical protein
MLWASIVSFLAFPPWMAFIERAWPRTQGIPSWAQRSASQVPGEEAFDADDEILPVGRHALEEWLGRRLQLAVDEDLSSLVQDAEVQRASMQVDATIILMWLGVEPHEVSSSFASFCPTPAYHGGMPRRGPQ